MNIDIIGAFCDDSNTQVMERPASKYAAKSAAKAVGRLERVVPVKVIPTFQRKPVLAASVAKALPVVKAAPPVEGKGSVILRYEHSDAVIMTQALIYSRARQGEKSVFHVLEWHAPTTLQLNTCDYKTSDRRFFLPKERAYLFGLEFHQLGSKPPMYRLMCLRSRQFQPFHTVDEDTVMFSFDSSELRLHMEMFLGRLPMLPPVTSLLRNGEVSTVLTRFESERAAMELFKSAGLWTY